MVSEAVLTMASTRSVRTALRGLGGRATVGDVSAATGLAAAEAEAALRKLLEDHRGHLEVGERGDLVYRFDPRLLRRDQLPFWERVAERSWEVFKATFKVGIAVMLVVYFLVFVALLIAAIVASQSRDGDRGGFGGRRRGHGHGHFGFGNFWFWYLIWSPNWGWHRPYYGERYVPDTGRGRGKKTGPPFYKKVFAFVFGPDRPVETRERKDRRLLHLIRSRQGALSAAELVQLTGMGLEEAEEELARLMAAHDGEVRVADDGTLVYLFPQLMVSAHGRVDEREAAPAWRRLEPALPLTGNSAGTNALVIGMNAFTLVAAATAPLFIFPQLKIDGPLAWIGLVWIPVAFSTLFFAVPALRWIGVTRENARRAARNVRKVLLGLVSRATLSGPTDLPVDEAAAVETVKRALGSKESAVRRVPEEMNRLVAEFDGEVEPSETGSMLFRFPGFRRAIEAAHRVRRAAALGLKEVGRVVFDSGDDSAAESKRDLESFDEALALPEPDALTHYLADPDRFAFRDELELAALEEEMRLRKMARARVA